MDHHPALRRVDRAAAAAGRALTGRLLIYGANGYTGALIAREAARRGLAPVLAGRRGEPVAALADALGQAHRVAALDDRRALAAALDGVRVVLHCAGPFSATSRPMADACLAARCHYLDITGELSVFRELLARDAEARAAGVTLLPGVGLDVVPVDCVAAALAARLPGAQRLELALLPLGDVSRGTTLTMIAALGARAAVVRDGRLHDVGAGALPRDVDFVRGRVRCAVLPWGDVVAAFHSTAIPDITVRCAVPRVLRAGLRAARLSGGLLASAPVRRLLAARAARRPVGPDAAQRAAGSCLVHGEAWGAGGRRVEARLATPEGYTFTVLSALEIARRALDGALPTGFQTPSRACGAGFVLQLPGVAGSGMTEPAGGDRS